MTARKQSMPVWGAHWADGSALFRLWAPALQQLTLDLDGRSLAMQRSGNGWFEATTAEARAGAEYRFVLPDGTRIPDPAARAQASDVHGPSILSDTGFDWQASDWAGRPLEEVVVYELHTGTFSPEGTFDGVRHRLDHLGSIGVTAIELMPVAQFSGDRGWGYDGVLHYCPHRAYGGAESLKRLVDAAHQRGLMVFLDVVYNHFGPDGNYLSLYAPDFFDPDRHTPWGPAIRFEEPAVRSFFSDNAIYWLDEFRFDGLRFDAIDQIKDQSETHILEEIAQRIRRTFPDRHIHLMTEDERNIVALHPRDAQGRPRLFSAEWNDDVHHAAHCIATGEDEGYYEGFADDAVGHLGRALAEGFVYQGEPYGPRDGKGRGVPSAGQPPTAFVAFLQNHDQIGNRGFGERLTTLADAEIVELLTAILLLSPQLPLLYMGEEYSETRPFLFFTDFHGDLAKAVREGRRKEFAAFGHYGDDRAESIPDPNAPQTMEASRLDWTQVETEGGKRRLDLIRTLLRLRREHLVPHLGAMRAMQGEHARLSPDAFSVVWRMGAQRLSMFANFGDEAAVPEAAARNPVYESRPGVADALREGRLPARCVAVLSAPDEPS